VPALEIKDMTVGYGDVSLVKNVSITVEEGEWFALVGESGSGKSITASTIGALLPGQLKVVSGEIRFLGRDMHTIDKHAVREIRGKHIAYVFQDYGCAFTPFIRIGKQMDELIQCHEKMEKAQRTKKILWALADAGLDAERTFRSYPFQLSGGQLQRSAIAQAILLRPELIIADEPTTALDAITARKILELLTRIKEQLGCSILFITHDLRCVKRYADKAAIMQNGSIVESGKTAEIFANPKTAYTRNLFASIPPLRNVPERLHVG
jgi:peptide/nickel transport system ATP-binding protein